MSYIKLIDATISKKRSKGSKKPPAFRPSALGTPCLRKLFYSYLRTPVDFESPAWLNKYAHIGDKIHDLLSGYLRDAGVLVDYRNEEGNIPKRYGRKDPEFPLKDTALEMSAKIDAVTILDNVLWLGEFKTCKSGAFKKLVAPKPEHLIQAVAYLYLFRKALKDGQYAHIKALSGFSEVAGIIVLYYNKDDCAMKEFVVKSDDTIFKHIINKIQTIKNCVQTKVLPNPSPHFCRTCEWRKKCESGHNPLI